MSESTKKFKVVTLGCRTNQYESQAFTDQMLGLGMSQALEGEVADVCVVNTCTVTESADATSRQQIRQLARQNPGAKILVTGCLAERDPSLIASIEGVSHVVANKDKESLLATLYPGQPLPEFSIKTFDAHTRAFVKVQDGCNSFCTYCIIPYVRGRSRSRPLPEILKEVRALVDSGYKEIVLTGINIGDFDGAPEQGQQPLRLADLVRAVDAIGGVERLRISSIDPDEVDDDLIDAVIQGRSTCHSMHIVLQSGSNVILKKMNRKYTKEIFQATVERLLAAAEDFTFTTDIIVGFPGESDADFNDTLEVMQKVRFAKVHMFPYSERQRTRAALFPGKVPQDIVRERKHKLLALSETLSFSLRQEFVGKVMKVLIEGKEPSREGWVSGHTENFLQVLVEGKDLSSNTIVEVCIEGNSPEGLIGRRLV
jgi:threonylcarbamoyladenosine tRNA methylthiotransferase MtaB